MAKDLNKTCNQNKKGGYPCPPGKIRRTKNGIFRPNEKFSTKNANTVDKRDGTWYNKSVLEDDFQRLFKAII